MQRELSSMNTLAASHPLSSSAPPSDEGFFAYHGVWAPGVRLFRQLRFGAKALLVSLALVLPLLALQGWQLLGHYDRTLRAREDATRQHVEVAQGVIAWAHEQEKSGKATREEAQRMALAAVRGMRYDANEYFWINDMTPVMLMHPMKPELEGKELSGMKDPNGFAMFEAFTDMVRRNDKGFVGYQWPRPGADKPVDKISYVMGFKPWGWVIGSGVYVDDIRKDAWRQASVSGGVVLAALLLGGYLFLCFYRVMNGGLRETRRHLRAMTKGDLTTSPSPWGHDEAAQLMNELRTMQEALRHMVTRVRTSSERIMHSSHEIACGADDLSARTEQTAESLKQSASSMDQITTTVKATADHTDEAARVARANAEVAEAGGKAMHEVVQTMERILASSTTIGEITGAIDSIAFQTTILALNAAVASARAGDPGRGFAVVASEVRMLAQRSAEAAREIKTLIASSVELVESGAGVVRHAESQIDEIVGSSQRVNQLLGDVANSAREQSASIGQIGGAVHELDRMTHQNAGLVQQTAGAAAAMKDQSDVLAAEVAHFHLPA
jgi:methyl-accepting chemotaxis protein